jgi:hypothetical protein
MPECVAQRICLDLRCRSPRLRPHRGRLTSSTATLVGLVRLALQPALPQLSILHPIHLVLGNDTMQKYSLATNEQICYALGMTNRLLW